MGFSDDDDNDDTDDTDLFLSSLRKKYMIISIIKNIMINRIIKIHYLKKINAPTVIAVIVIAVIDGREISRKDSRRFS